MYLFYIYTFMESCSKLIIFPRKNTCYYEDLALCANINACVLFYVLDLKTADY